MDFKEGIRLLARITRVAEREFNKAGISLPQYRLLISISCAPLRAGDLAAAIGVSRPTLTSLVDGLARAGLVEREPVPDDRRGIRLRVTDAGQAAVSAAEGNLNRRLNSLVGDAAAGALHEVMEVIRTLADALSRDGECPLDS